MEVRITKPIQLEVGEVINLPDFRAKELIRDGYAVLSIVRHFNAEDTRSKQKFEKTVIL